MNEIVKSKDDEIKETLLVLMEQLTDKKQDKHKQEDRYLAKLKQDYPDLKISAMGNGCGWYGVRNKNGDMMEIFTTHIIKSDGKQVETEITGIKKIIYNCYKSDINSLEKFITLLKE